MPWANWHDRAFDLLDADGPVLASHPVVIEADETPLAWARRVLCGISGERATRSDGVPPSKLVP